MENGLWPSWALLFYAAHRLSNQERLDSDSPMLSRIVFNFNVVLNSHLCGARSEDKHGKAL
jgi:hypothetical protein